MLQSQWSDMLYHLALVLYQESAQGRAAKAHSRLTKCWPTP